MLVIKKSLIFWMCLSFFFFQIPYISSTVEAGITATKPEMISSAEEDIPAVEQAESSSKGGGKKWLWALLGVVVLIGGVAAVAGGGSSSSGGNGGDSTASYNFSW
jgi:hypothetical protein